MIDKINLYLCLGAVLILFVAMLGNASRSPSMALCCAY